jgi:Leucine-rich repeat (LRR) protein
MRALSLTFWIAVFAVGTWTGCGSEPPVAPDAEQTLSARLTRPAGKGPPVYRTVAATTVTLDDTPVEGLEVALSRSISGRSADYRWKEITDANGRAAIEIVADPSGQFWRAGVAGYYIARATDLKSGEVVAKWGNIPIRAKKDIFLFLPIGGPASVSERPSEVLISEIAFVDSLLAACVRETGATYASELTRLDCPTWGIRDLSGIEQLTNLEELNLFLNRIGDIGPLAGLTNLTFLELGHNQITDLTPLGSLTDLTTLFVSNNSIRDIDVLGSLTNLTRLDLMENNGIEDISALANLTNLTGLLLNRNRVRDVGPLSNLVELTTLGLFQNDIRDVRPLANLTNLTVLNLSSNNLSDIRPLVDLADLVELGLNHNNISDVSALSALTNLELLTLNNNTITTGVANLVTLTHAAVIQLTSMRQ